MSSALSGLKISVIGGDERELILISELVTMGATVTVTGFPKDRVCHGAFVVDSVNEALKSAEAVILPLPGTNTEGVIRAVFAENQLKLTEQGIANLGPNNLVIIGSAREYLKEWSEKYGFKLLEIIEMDDLAILNSIPTAEGAIQIAMEQTPITIHGSNICVIGFGRVAVTLARSLKALGAEVTAVARNQGQLARAYEMGLKIADYDHLKEITNNSDIIYNTVPAMMLDKSTLKYCNPDAVIIDLAAQPGGTDFEAANSYGLKAILAPGLPGKVAPTTAGKILANVIPRLIINELADSKGNLLFG
ncbi:Dipicolinate synthase subunit A [Candidatus Syntrophocurvum alkaliphilum]|uniref:Dipicolinate synthase subunit A n=1 Tax=Candidatus Syntrophocurvum alkaliphilum TaxID=2293317 RepID=A0A6I6D9X5_9FIRM|nr:dipicolinate synthase subunit DpsA [Candidatus Syntrophocurvum alkaliphilum]QGT99658.1 Dipicolinate synthase subunit A [Candidatus Syntrophocurvum alkaliphilum]